MIDYHIHSQHSIDAAGTIEEYCERALEIGLREICFTNHCELDPERDDSFIRFNGDRETFSRNGLLKLQEEIFRARDRYKQQGLSVKFGIEVGYHQGIEPKLREMFKDVQLDFVIGAIHCLDHICIDSSRECGEYFKHHDVQQLTNNYYAEVARLVQSRLFDSLAHIDVYKKYGRNHYGRDVDNPPPDLVSSVLRLIKINHIALEINTAGMRFMNEFYPAPALMKLARQHDLDLITIGSDSHKPEDLGKDVMRAIEYLKAHGFNYVHTFDRREHSGLKI